MANFALPDCILECTHSLVNLAESNFAQRRNMRLFSDLGSTEVDAKCVHTLFMFYKKRFIRNTSPSQRKNKKRELVFFRGLKNEVDMF